MALWIERPPHYPEVGGSNTNISPKSFSILRTTCGKDAKKGSQYTINAMLIKVFTLLFRLLSPFRTFILKANTQRTPQKYDKNDGAKVPWNYLSFSK